ncbi:hypothetical protein FA15DRAFT_663831 [Coprinopsis marcescibilis]|uniref:Uncharacterized protein n=1 Tax=Coprinopsis marcescibilis TaxID=230819 RepID=A0A5C3L9F9_COPMA|nr:hypothetical protein FA15DRAFT_663831 [Coprinopsis marcescibilis]
MTVTNLQRVLYALQFLSNDNRVWEVKDFILRLREFCKKGNDSPGPHTDRYVKLSIIRLERAGYLKTKKLHRPDMSFEITDKGSVLNSDIKKAAGALVRGRTDERKFHGVVAIAVRFLDGKLQRLPSRAEMEVEIRKLVGDNQDLAKVANMLSKRNRKLRKRLLDLGHERGSTPDDPIEDDDSCTSEQLSYMDDDDDVSMDVGELAEAPLCTDSVPTRNARTPVLRRSASFAVSGGSTHAPEPEPGYNVWDGNTPRESESPIPSHSIFPRTPLPRTGFLSAAAAYPSPDSSPQRNVASGSRISPAPVEGPQSSPMHHRSQSIISDLSYQSSGAPSRSRLYDTPSDGLEQTSNSRPVHFPEGIVETPARNLCPQSSTNIPASSPSFMGMIFTGARNCLDTVASLGRWVSADEKTAAEEIVDLVNKKLERDKEKLNQNGETIREQVGVIADLRGKNHTLEQALKQSSNDAEVIETFARSIHGRRGS